MLESEMTPRQYLADLAESAILAKRRITRLESDGYTKRHACYRRALQWRRDTSQMLWGACCMYERCSGVSCTDAHAEALRMGREIVRRMETSDGMPYQHERVFADVTSE